MDLSRSPLAKRLVRRSALGVAALAAALTVAALAAPTASATNCGNVGGGREVRAFGASCGDAAAVVAAFYANATCSSTCAVTAAGRTWRCDPPTNGPFAGCNSGLHVQVIWRGRGPSGGTASISGLAVSPSTFKALSSGGPVAATASGSTVRYSLSSASRVVFTVLESRPGRKVGRRCVAPNRSNRTRPRCTRTLTKGSFRVQGASGSNSFRFSGRVGGHKLAPGSYTLRGQPQGSSSKTSRGFRIVLR